MLTPEQEANGRRNFLKVLAGTPALVALGAAAATRGPVPGGPVRVGFVGVGGQGRTLLTATAVGAVPTGYAQIRALADINPNSLKLANEQLQKNHHAPVNTYATWQEMLQKEDIEAVIMAPPLWAHADIATGCLDAGKHVLCEKMMAWDIPSCERMMRAAETNRRVFEIGYQRNYNTLYEAAFDGIINKGVLGDVFLTRLAWHRNGNWRRQGQPPSPDYNPSAWGYPTFEHLLNWRLYMKYSKGLFAELASHQINITNQVYKAMPEAVSATGGVYRFKDGREAWDHVYATFEFPGGRTAVFSSIESNAFDDYYEMYMGTKGTLIIRREVDAMLFEEGGTERATNLEVSPRGNAPVIDASETQAANRPASAEAPARNPGAGEGSSGRPLVDRSESSRRQIRGFCSAIRTGKPLQTGAEKAFHSARACIRAHDAVVAKTRLAV
jgi:predicted dehydrogenase